MRRSTKTAILVSLAISSAVGGAFGLLTAPSDGASVSRVKDLESQVASLTAETQRLSAAVSQIQMLLLSGPPGAETASAPTEKIAPAQLALTADASAESRRIFDADSQAAATSEALDARFDEQRRLLFIQMPECKKPDDEGLIICAITMRNNAEQALQVSFSQSGSRAVLTPGQSFSSIRMRQPGQSRFAYTATMAIPGKDLKVLEIAFGPTQSSPDKAQSIALTVNKMTYKFEDVPLGG